MKRRLLAAAAALMLLASQSVAAAADWGYDNYDYNYDYGYGDYTGDQGWTDNTWTDNTWTDNTWDNTNTENDNGQTGENTVTDVTGDSSSENESKPDASNNVPVNVVLEQSKIVDKRFNVDVKLDTKSKVTGMDLTIIYDTNVLKLTGSVVNKKAASKQGKGVAAETEAGTVQYQFNDPNGSEWKESFLTLSFEVVDPLERASAIYSKVNSILDEYGNILSYRADGTIVQIAGAVEYDAKDDESMYTELRVAKSDTPLTLDSLGLTNVASVQIEDKKLASSDNKSITTLGIGLTNMSVEFTDGTKKYYRLVVAQSAPKAVIPITGNAEVPADEKTAVTEAGSGTAAAAPAVNKEVKEPDQGLTKTETREKSKVKYLIIYILVLVAVIAIIVEFFVIYGNPYAKTAAILKQRKEREQDYDPNEGFNGAPLSVPERNNNNNPYSSDDGYSDEYGYADGYEDDDSSYGQEGYEGYDDRYDRYEQYDQEQNGYSDEYEYGYADDTAESADGYGYAAEGEEADYYDDDDAYDGYDESGYSYDPNTVEGYEGDDAPSDIPDDEVEYITDDDIILGDEDESDFDGDIVPKKDEIELEDSDDFEPFDN